MVKHIPDDELMLCMMGFMFWLLFPSVHADSWRAGGRSYQLATVFFIGKLLKLVNG